ncbi:3-deoxy-D-manno-octulosonate 8-phosphate phosphatase KdsC [bioreactor metagenome]|uniref:3-deoxy-D-manno-octulosonate 8-phosphate phosphatase KdsC n=1 Tax=bioreactor metagenome TaxID=1076179 RepID=A0A645AHH6_9ZZZZ|nr:HAD hydrolase family protein [Candidatus Metalachnospira sp.]
MMNIKNKRIIKLLILDVDGTLTDGKIYIGINGEMMKAFNIKDGFGLHNILPTINGGITPVIITGRRSNILENRCSELGIVYLYQEVIDKLQKLKELLCEFDLELFNVAYIGDDINDLPCMLAVHYAGGIIACPNDAVKEVKETADFISEKDGGNGAVRDFIEWLKYI